MRKVTCGRFPYRFDFKMTVQGVDRVFNKRNMLVVCEDRKIAFTFRAEHRYEEMMGKKATLTLSGVEDLGLNELVDPARVSFQVQKIQTKKAMIQVDNMVLNMTTHPDMSDKNSAVFLETSRKIKGEILALLQTTDDRVRIIKIAKTDNAGRNNAMSVSFIVSAAESSKQDSAPTSAKLVGQLEDLIEAHSAYKRQGETAGAMPTSLLAISNSKLMSKASAEPLTFLTRIIPCSEDVAAFEQQRAEVSFATTGNQVAPEKGAASWVAYSSFAYQNAILVVGIIIVVLLFRLNSKQTETTDV